MIFRNSGELSSIEVAPALGGSEVVLFIRILFKAAWASLPRSSIDEAGLLSPAGAEAGFLKLRRVGGASTGSGVGPDRGAPEVLGETALFLADPEPPGALGNASRFLEAVRGGVVGAGAEASLAAWASDLNLAAAEVVLLGSATAGVACLAGSGVAGALTGTGAEMLSLEMFSFEEWLSLLPLDSFLQIPKRKERKET